MQVSPCQLALVTGRAGSPTARPGLRTVPPLTGLFCNRTFDDYACWPDGLPGSFVNVSCPWYLPWANSGESPPPHMDYPSPCPEAWGWAVALGPGTCCFLLLSHSLLHPRRTLDPLWAACLSLWGTVVGITCNLGLRPVMTGGVGASVGSDLRENCEPLSQ